MLKKIIIALTLCASSVAGSAQTTAPKNDYHQADAWLCRPGRTDACAADLTTTIVAADGKLKEEKFKANAAAPIDCFYVYPTVSLDTTGNSDMVAGLEEKRVIQHQFARFGGQCRLYAPLYRQVTLTALRARMSGKPMTADMSPNMSLGYNDVVAAWNHYLANDNQGRGVVLIGHSQGSGVLTQLIKNEIDGKPIQEKMISALLLGTNLTVAKGKDIGGAFRTIPLCRSANQTGCAISYVTFRANQPPPEGSLFGRTTSADLAIACTNPAALAGGSGALHAYLGNGQASGGAAPPAWTKPAQEIKTPFVSVPGLLTGQCVSNDKGSYLAVTVNGNPADARTDEVAGDVVTNGQVQAGWGLHLIDANVAMGNLVNIVSQQAKAYLAKQTKK